MKLYFRQICILVISLSALNINLYANGLRFKGSEHLIDERTSYDVFCGKAPKFSEKLDVTFDISLLEPSHYGYIFRIKNNETNKTYNLSYYIDGPTTVFKLNEEGGKNLITAKLGNEELQKLHWFKVSITFDLKNHSLSLVLNKLLFKTNNINLPQTWSPEIYFGRSDYLIDVPSFAIKQLSITDKKHTYLFPLAESKGNVAHNIKGEEFGQITNPVWLINDSYYWSYKKRFKSTNIAGCSFDAKTDYLYIFSRDSLKTYNVRTGEVTAEAFSERCPVEIFLGTSFIDSDEKKLYVYEVCYEKNEKGPNIAVLDLKTKRWSTVSYSSTYMQLHHHSACFENKHYYIFGGFGGFGGFGNMQYSKSLFSFNFDTNKWDSLKLSGDKINPRYFSTMGYRKDPNSLYIFGGMGNESGEQIVGRRYFYDLYKINLNNNHVTQLWKIPWDRENVVPVRQMIIQNDFFYTLCYPEHFSKTFLKLYRFSLKDGSYKILGDSIPMRSEKIKTKASIYYSSNLNCLFAIVQEFDNFDISSSIKVYSLAFPPISYEELTSQESLFKGDLRSIIITAVSVLLLIVLALFIIIRRKKKQSEDDADAIYLTNNGDNDKKSINKEKTEPKPNSICLFGEFTVHDRQNKDITYMFSTKLKQVFLTILQFSSENGISSQKLSEMLWPDKPEDKVKNSRGVTINHLRKIMKELDGIELIFEKGMFKIVISPELCYCDYLRCIELIDSNTVEKNISEFINITNQGKFLKSIDLPEFDSFKEDVERKLEPALLIEAERSFNNELYKTTLILCEALFYIDPINEDALYYTLQVLQKLKMNNEAKRQYFQFVSEYKKMQGRNYSIPLNELLTDKKRNSKYST